MSMIYKEGTASLTKGSPVLKGKDTYFLNPIFNVGVGQIVQVKTGDNVYVNSIKEVVDNETLILSFDSLEDVTDGEIVIMITMVDSISDTANKLLGMTRGLVQFETEMTKWFTSMDKKITITLPDGTKKEVYTLQAIMEQVAQNEKEMQELLQNSEKKVNDMVDKAQEDVNNVVTDGTNKINQAVDKADKEINEAITSGTGKIDTMLTESQKKIDKTIEDTEVKVDTELGKIDEKIGNRIDGKVDKSGDTMTGSLISKGYLKSDGGEVNASEGNNSIAIIVQNGVQQIVTKTGDSGYIRNTLPDHNGRILAEGDYGIGGRQTLGDKDLNDVKIPGDYQQDRSANATKEKNYPINTAGYLNVKQTVNGWGNGCIQQYHIYAGVGYFQRTWNGSAWSSWERFMTRGDYGLGNSAVNNTNPPQETIKDALSIEDTRFVSSTGGDAINYAEQYSPMLSMARFGGSDQTGKVVHVQYYETSGYPEHVFRVRNTGKWSGWYHSMILNHGGLQKLSGSLVAQNHRIGANPLSATRDGNDYLNIYPPKVGDGNDLGFFQYNFNNTWNGVLKIPRVPIGGTRELVVKEGNNILVYGSQHWAGLRLYKASGEYAMLETNSSDNEILSLAYRNSRGDNVSVLRFPRQDGQVMIQGDYGFAGNGVSEGLDESKLTSKVFDSKHSQIFRSSSNPGKFGTIYSPILFLTTGDTWATISTSYLTGNVTVASSNRNRSNPIKFNNLWGTSNTTTDSNGFIKRASPVININPDGTFTTNDESEGATVTQVAQGEYLIEGVLGFNSDAGWGGVDGGIEIPLDVNKQPLIWVDSEVLEDGSIIIRTYHREHKDVPPFARNLRRGYNDGDPCDIPTGRFISIRVNMPENSIFNTRERESMEEMREMESNPFYKEERAFPNIIFNKKGDL